MSSLWEQRAARNEALFREVNENIARLEERHGATADPVFLCECANADCADHVPVEPDVYARVRENPRLFFVIPGHEDPQLERVVGTHRDYLIVEKTGAAGEVAEQTQEQGL
jgi:formate-nitrite transporter family protein